MMRVFFTLTVIVGVVSCCRNTDSGLPAEVREAQEIQNILAVPTFEPWPPYPAVRVSAPHFAAALAPQKSRGATLKARDRCVGAYVKKFVRDPTAGVNVWPDFEDKDDGYLGRLLVAGEAKLNFSLRRIGSGKTQALDVYRMTFAWDLGGLDCEG